MLLSPTWNIQSAPTGYLLACMEKITPVQLEGSIDILDPPRYPMFVP